MSQPTRVYFVCSPHPRAGKTLGARLCAEFQSASARPVFGFDLGADQPRFAEFLPTLATYSCISDIRGQMALFDKLTKGDCHSKVVDISHRIFESFFTIMRDFDFASEARRNAVSPIILFIARLDEASIKSYTTLREWFPALTFVPVHNEAIAQRPRPWTNVCVEQPQHFPAANYAVFAWPADLDRSTSVFL